MENKTTVTLCQMSYRDITPVTRNILGIAFIISSFLASIGNLISLTILFKPSMRSKCNKILSSLVFSDTFVGVFLCPFLAAQLLSETLFKSCGVELVKSILAPWMGATSGMSMALIGYDRYVMLSSFNNYDDRMSKIKINILIVAAWIVPFLMIMTVFVSRLLFVACLTLLAFIPLIVTVVSYYSVVKYVKKNTFHFTNDEEQNIRRKEQNKKLVQKLTFLVICYVSCLLPLTSAFFYEIFTRVLKRERTAAHQTLTIFGIYSALLNSVLNPIIYVSKFPDMKKEFYKMFSIRSNEVCDGVTSSNQTTSEVVSEN
ncbi:high-affinity lysophosphatidic acid receptor-like [Clytia hemisphaerica]|uniref:high-affinity lysophosphatidic acid receptor-like n=1 Tax=Clytia hemisphaerica TaxID=252671 RepID=UPI0034D78405